MITLISHGFKYGRPKSNFYFDVSYLVNPWRQKKLRNAPKKDIMKFMYAQEGFNNLMNSISQVIFIYEDMWPNENLVFAFCCSAGEYRSPVVIEAIKENLKSRGIDCKIKHSNQSKI